MDENHDIPQPPALTTAERQSLRGQAHHLDPVVLIGDAGLTDAVVREVDRALTTHELIKVRIAGDDRESRDAIRSTLPARLGCAVVQSIGKTLVLWRPRPVDEQPEKPRQIRRKLAPLPKKMAGAGKKPALRPRKPPRERQQEFDDTPAGSRQPAQRPRKIAFGFAPPKAAPKAPATTRGGTGTKTGAGPARSGFGARTGAAGAKTGGFGAKGGGFGAKTGGFGAKAGGVAAGRGRAGPKPTGGPRGTGTGASRSVAGKAAAGGLPGTSRARPPASGARRPAGGSVSGGGRPAPRGRTGGKGR